MTTIENEAKNNKTPYIVGIGASAGGVEALQQIFDKLPNNTGFAYIIIQHLSPDYKSLMSDILARYTDMPVIEAEDNMPVKVNHVYLIPPRKNLTILGGHLKLEEANHSALNRPIDLFFNSLAEESKEKAIGIVLSGTGSDGTNGVKRIKEQGGIVIAQEPESSKFDGMPKNVINTGLADFVLNPDEITTELCIFSQSHQAYDLDSKKIKGAKVESVFYEEEAMSYIYNLLKNASGIDFTFYKRSTILRRIERRMIVTHTTNLADFSKLLSDNPKEVNILVKEILIGVTNFFRDDSFFEKLKCDVVYKIINSTKEGDSIRVWSAGCSSGEEAYSIAILFQEAMEELQTKRDIKIFATDVDATAIERAGKGIYGENILDDVNTDRIAKFFVKRGNNYHVSKQIRRMIIFATHNIFADPPFGKLDLVVCRNVMIYFQPILRKRLFAIFHSALKNNGYLFLGKSETANEYSNIFIPISNSEKIYIHKGEGKVENLAPPTFSMPKIENISMIESNEYIMESKETISESLYTHFLESYLPASAVLNENNEIIHFFGNYNDYLSLPSGKASFNIFNMIHVDIRLAVSTAISRCREEKRPVTYKDIAVDCADGRRIIDLRVEPINLGYDNDTRLIAVLFIENGTLKDKGIVEKYDINETAAKRIADLEKEFLVSQSDLKATIQRLETVNGELQAANEELLTANEELQSSTEELQSVNEELYTVNTEHQLKLDELTTTTNDLNNFLSSTMIGILFVDSNLNIRKFTEYVGREFQLMDHDVGRPIQIFAHSFPEEEIEKDCNTVLKNLTSIDREVSALNGRFYTLRIAPYRTMENSIRGLVITIIDSLGAKSK